MKFASRLGLLATAAFAPAIALAQTPAASGSVAEAGRGQLEEVVVTARKQSEALLDVPLAITALTGADLDRRQINTLDDLARFTPGFYYSGFAVGRNDRSITISNLVFRAMRLANFSGVGAGAMTFIDGTPLVSGVVDDVGELERVEVIRGPQSAYFGRGTFAGAVNLVTREPSDVLKAKIDVDLGSYAKRDGKVTVEGPLLGDTLRFRVSGRARTEDGPYDNAFAPGQRLGDQSTKSFNGVLYAKPTERLKAKLFFRYLHFDDGPGASTTIQANQYNCDAGLGAGRNNYFCGEVPRAATTQIGFNPVSAAFLTQVVDNRAGLIRVLPTKRRELGLNRDDYATILSADYDLGAGYSLSFIGSYNISQRFAIVDSDGFDTRGFANPLFPARSDVDSTRGSWVILESESRDASQELRLTSPSDKRLRGSLGVSHIYQNVIQTNPSLAASGPTNGGGGQRDSADTTGLFGALSFDILSNLTLDLEGRHQIDKIRTVAPAPLYTLFTATYRSFTPRVILSYKVTPGATLYGLYSRGVRPGSFNAALTTFTPAEVTEIIRQTRGGLVVEQEYVDNYEIGLKGRFLGGRLQGSIDAYRDEWTDQQVRSFANILRNGVFQSVLVIGNLGETELSGVEMEGQFQATSKLLLSGSFAWNHSEFKTYFCSTCQTAITGRSNVNGNQIQKAPEYVGSVSAAWRDRLTENLDWFARGDFTYTGRQYETEANLAYLPAQKIVNLRIGVEADRYQLEGYVLNATDDDSYVGLDRNANAIVGGNVLIVGLPQKRRFGVRASYRF